MIEKIFNKLNKIPSWVGWTALFVSSMILALPTMLSFDTFLQKLNEYFLDALQQPFKVNVAPQFKYFVGAMEAIISCLIIEAVSQIVYGWAFRNRYTNRGKKFYLNSVRYSMAAVQTVYGLYSLIAVWAPSVFSYSGEAVLFVLRTAVITAMFMGIRKECVNDKFVFLVYNRLYCIYFIYNGALWLLNFFTSLLATEIKVGSVIFDAVMVIIIAASAAALYFTVYKKLKKEQEEARQTIILPPTSGGDSEIFRGYGM